MSPSGLSSGTTYTGSVVVNQPGSSTSGLTIPVTVNVGGVPTVTVSPAQLAFAFQVGTSAPPSQILNVTTSGGQALPFTATPSTTTCGTGWLVVTPQSSATGSPVTVQINTAGLSGNANCSGQISINVPGTSNPTLNVPVSLLVSTNPLLNVSTTGLTFTYQPGAAIPQPQTFQISTSSTALAYGVTTAAGSGGQNFLTVNPTSGVASATSPAPVTVSLNPNVLPLLAPGTQYTVNVSVTGSGAANSPITFPVTLTVTNNSTLVVNQPSATFNYQIGQAFPSPQVISVSSTGAPLTFTAAATSTNCGNFLSVTQSNPTTPSATGQPATIVLSAAIPSGTAAGTCTGTVTLTPSGATTPAVTIPVTVNVSSTPLINVSPTAINVTVQAGSTTPVIQTIAVTSTDLVTSLSVQAIAATTPPGQIWLSVTPNQTVTGSNLTVRLDPTGLAVGTYSGSILVSSSTSGIPTQTVPVTFTVASAQVIVSAASLSFSQALGGPNPASQTITLTGVPQGSTVGAIATTLNGGSGWLTASVANGVVTVSANGSQLQQGMFNGVITIFVPGASNSPINIPVTFTVGAAVTLGVNPTNLSFNYTAGSSTTPPSQTVQLTSTGGNVPFTITVATQNNSNFLTVSPMSGDTKGTTAVALTVGLNQSVISTLPPGTYTGTVTVTSPNAPGGNQVVNVTLTIAQAPPPSIGFILNAATLLPGAISPGELVAIKGSALGPSIPLQTQITPTGMVSTNLGGTQVFFGNVAAPLTYVSDTQINAVVPYEVDGQVAVSVTVNRNGVVTPVGIQQAVIPTSPGLFTNSGTGSGELAAFNEDITRNSDANPAAKGSVIVLYGTGEGVLQNGGVTGSVTPNGGPYPAPKATPLIVMIGGIQAQTQFFNEAPGLVEGVIQINAIVPANVASGDVPVVLTIGNFTSPSTATIAIK
ncbi:MAG TPA: IPT/TIG domain-containing protein [Bryobacteraceae bacterium]|nr:IPT/TIG domain-containing protein [Bryobacteraceae bacterium]